MLSISAKTINRLVGINLITNYFDKQLISLSYLRTICYKLG